MNINRHPATDQQHQRGHWIPLAKQHITSGHNHALRIQLVLMRVKQQLDPLPEGVQLRFIAPHRISSAASS